MEYNQLCDLLNVFYQDINPDLANRTLLAIRSANTAGEFESRPEIFQSLRELIISFANDHFGERSDPLNNHKAVNIYMRSNTRGSVTRQFFYHMTLPENFYPEDNVNSLPPFLPPLRSYTEQARIFLSQPGPEVSTISIPPFIRQ